MKLENSVVFSRSEHPWEIRFSARLYPVSYDSMTLILLLSSGLGSANLSHLICLGETVCHHMHSVQPRESRAGEAASSTKMIMRPSCIISNVTHQVT